MSNNYVYSNGYESKSYSDLNTDENDDNNDNSNNNSIDHGTDNGNVNDNNYGYVSKGGSAWSSKEIGFIVGISIGGLLLIFLIIILIILVLKYRYKSKQKIENLSSSSESLHSNDFESHSDLIRPNSRSLSVRSESMSLLVRLGSEAELIRPTTAFVMPENTVEILQSSSLSSLD